MSIPEQRKGSAIGFHLYGSYSLEHTLGDPQKIVWSSIKHLCSTDVADVVLKNIHGVTSKRARDRISRNLKIYLNHAHEFYKCGEESSADTSPLLYYYSFLNLAKALCTIKYPYLHKQNESFRHGLSWRHSKNSLVDMNTTTVSVSGRGMWHFLWEKLADLPLSLPNPTKIKIKDLFALLPETSIEYSRTFAEESRYVDLVEPEGLVDSEADELWLRFSVSKDDLREFRLSRRSFIQIISGTTPAFRQVRSKDDVFWTFELFPAKKIPVRAKDYLYSLIDNEVKAMKLFVHPSSDDLSYYVPIQNRLPVRLHQITVLYTIMFWLGSLVRYDPHSVANLRESQFWILIDGFLNQSRIWLLELFEWEFFKTETYLRTAR